MAEEKITVEVEKLWAENIAMITAESGIVPKIKVGDRYKTTGAKVDYTAENYSWLTTGGGSRLISGKLTVPTVNGYNIAVLYDTGEFALLDTGGWRILEKDVLGMVYFGIPVWLWIIIIILIIVAAYFLLRKR